MFSMVRLLKADSEGHTLFCLAALCILLLGGCSEGVKRDALPTKTEGGNMVTISIDFQDGFTDDTVVLKLNREEVFRKEAVSTKLLLGKADSFKTEVETGPVNIEVNVQTKGIAKTFLLEVSADTYIGISIVNGMIEYILSNEPFGYY